MVIVGEGVVKGRSIYNGSTEGGIMSKEDLERQLKAWNRVIIDQLGIEYYTNYVYNFIAKHEAQIREEKPDSPALVWFDDERLRREIGL